jgi:aspartyl protease family protein
MKKLLLISVIFFLSSCGGNKFTVTKIIDGNTIELSNGVTVTLDKVANSPENIKILERYLRGKILLYDASNEEIKDFSSDHITAMVYNSDGDCVNNLLSGIAEITKDREPEIKNNIPESIDKTIVHFDHSDGVLKIPVMINGVVMYFIFDTGASLISISQSVADDLYNQRKLKDNDFIGKGRFSDANGDISEGTIINLSSVTIGNRQLNDVQACVIQGQNAPLLFGQSALQKFGKVSIDYAKNEITFE